MSEREERPYEPMGVEQNEGIQEGEEPRVEEKEKAMGVVATRSTAGEEQETVAKKKVPEQAEEKIKVKQKKKMASKSRIKDEQLDITSISKQLEKQTNYLARLEQVLKPLGNLGKELDLHSKIVKEIATSVKPLERRIMQIQKTIKKEKTSKK